VGRVELVDDGLSQPSGGLRSNLADPVCRALIVLVVTAQLADAVTTNVGLQRHLIELNPLFRTLLAWSPWLADAIKLGALAAVVVLALIRLPLGRARSALLLAVALSLIGPLANLRAHL
jgi:hypothetical protein